MESKNETDSTALDPSAYAAQLAEKRAFERAQIPGDIVGIPAGWAGVAVGTSPRAEVTISRLTNLGYLPCSGAKMVGDPMAKVFMIPEQSRKEMLAERTARIKARLQ